MPFLPDIGMGELLLIGIVALFIVGPERLPVVMEKLGIAFANLRHFVQGMTSGWGLTESDENMTAMPKKKPTKSTSDE